MTKRGLPKTYRVRKYNGADYTLPYTLFYEKVITDGERVNGATTRLRHTLDWSWIAFLIYAKAQGYEVDEI